MKSIGILFTAATTVAAQYLNAVGAVRRQESGTPTPTATIDYARVSEMLHSYMADLTISPMFPIPTETLGVSIPESLRNQIATTVPASVLINFFINEDYRESVAGEFAAGNTPAWYQSMDPELKTFFGDIAVAIQTGDAVTTRTKEPDADQTAEGEVDETSTSDDLARPTGASGGVFAGAVGAAGVFGVMLAL